MLPKREEFILDVRRAVRTEQKPLVTTDSEVVNEDVVSKAIQRAALWLTPKVVEAYDPAEFSASPDEQQKALQDAVERFRTTSASVPADAPASRDQFRHGLEAFSRLTDVVRQTVLSEWTFAAEELVRRVEQWSDELGWHTRQESKRLSETLLGDYSLPQLDIYSERRLYVLTPLARFVPGGLGAFDLSIQPSFYVKSVYRHLDNTWYVHLDAGRGANGAQKELLSKESFSRALEELRSLL